MGLLALVTAAGTVGYLLLGLSPLDALYQTVLTISTVGYREVGIDVAPPTAYRVFTVVLVMVGVGSAFYTLGLLMETLIEGRLADLLGRRRMERRIARMRDHVVVVGWGRVGQTIARYLTNAGVPTVVVDRDPDRLRRLELPSVLGDATDDAVLREAGIERARTLIAALDTDAANLFVTLSARSIHPGLFIIARARVEASEPKLLQAGADRVVNPQHIGGARMAAFALQPRVAEFLDVVMHDGSLEFRLEEAEVAEGAELAGRTLREARIRERTGALILALREPDGRFHTNPPPDTTI